MKFTTVYVSDDGTPSCFGVFATRDAAEALAERMEVQISKVRDEAGGGAGDVFVCPIHRASEAVMFA